VQLVCQQLCSTFSQIDPNRQHVYLQRVIWQDSTEVISVEDSRICIWDIDIKQGTAKVRDHVDIHILVAHNFYFPLTQNSTFLLADGINRHPGPEFQIFECSHEPSRARSSGGIWAIDPGLEPEFIKANIHHPGFATSFDPLSGL